ncbi:MAG: polysaccharide deacetylase family protein [Dehalococcoidia bacterium]
MSNGPRDVAKIALTFDMGGRVDPALAIMDWLEANSVRATIFMTGAIVRNVNTDAGRQVLGRIAARPDLFDIANHSDTHPDFTTIPASEMVAELAAAEREVARFLKASPRPFFRPPFGAQDADVVAGAAKAGYPVTVMWDVDTIDWRPESEGGPTANEIVTKVLAQAKAGSIVLMHLGGYNTLDALPRIVAGIKERGLQPVTLSDLLGVPQD